MKGCETIKIAKPLTIQELYDLLSKETLSAGKPELYTVLGQTGIQFPPKDGYKLVISVTKKAVTVTKTYDGAGGLAKEAGLDILSGGFRSIFGSKGENEADRVIKELGDDCRRLLAAYI